MTRVCSSETTPPTGSPVPGSATGGATAGATAVRPAPPRLDHLPMFRVLLHNDDVNVDVDVVRTITELTPLNKQEATEATIEAHKTGVALLLVTHKERAELYQDQFKSKFLTVTIEPVG